MVSSSGLWVVLGVSLFSLGMGIYGAYQWRKPWDAAGALWALLGLGGALISLLLLHVPNFF